MSPRIIRVTGILVAVAILFVAAYYLHKLTSIRPTFNTADMLLYTSDVNSPGHPHVWLTSADGKTSRELTHGTESDRDPSFSADGNQIAYVSDKSGQQQVYVMDADGKGAQPLTNDSDSKSLPSFSPDGDHVAYLTRGTLTIIDINSHDSQLVLPQPPSKADAASTTANYARDPVLYYAWAPKAHGLFDNTPIAAVQQDSIDNTQHLTLLSSTSADPVFLVSATTVSFAWSPNATTLAASIIGATAINGGSSTQNTLQPLPADRGFSGVLEFDPTGASPPSNIIVQKTVTSGPQNVLFTPDATSVSVEAWRDASGPASISSGTFLLPTQAGRPVQRLLGPGATDLCWSKTGAYAAFIGPDIHVKNARSLYVINVAARTISDVSKAHGDPESPKWSPQGSKAAPPPI